MSINYYVKKTLYSILIILVSILVILAFYNNKYKFTGIKTIKYKQIYVESLTNLEILAKEYADRETQDIFVSKVKKLNNIQTSTVIKNKILIVPLIEQ